MSLSFYYVVTYNLQHPSVKKLIGDIIDSNDSLMDLKVRSKLYHDFVEVTDAAHKDFDLKCEKIYDDDEISSQEVRWITAINPMFDSEDEPEGILTSDWQANCAGSIFFTEVDPSEEEEDEDGVPLISDPSSWMFKYEILFVEDIMEVPVNGESAFSPTLAGCTTSSYH